MCERCEAAERRASEAEAAARAAEASTEALRAHHVRVTAEMRALGVESERARREAEAACAAMRAELARHDRCAACTSTLHPPQSPPHCEDCIPDEEQVERWEEERAAYVEAAALRPTAGAELVARHARIEKAAAALLAAMPKCGGKWLRGSGGHRVDDGKRDRPGTHEWGDGWWHCAEHAGGDEKHGVYEAPWADELVALAATLDGREVGGG